MRNWRAWIGVVVLLAVASGCGSGGATSANGTLTPSLESAPTTSTGAADAQQQLDDYLSSLKPYRDDANAAIDPARPLLKAFEKNPTAATAAPAAAALANAAKVLNRLAPKVAAVIPPSGFDGSQFAEGVQNEANALSALSNDVKSISVAGIQTDVSAFQATTMQLVTWKIAVIQFAAAHGLTYAAWANKVGTTD
jgi:ABC-type transporter Mla subunit MlaD